MFCRCLPPTIRADSAGAGQNRLHHAVLSGIDEPKLMLPKVEGHVQS
jgi:hypothetical protein